MEDGTDVLPCKPSGPSCTRVSFHAAFRKQTPAPGLGTAAGLHTGHAALPEAGGHRSGRCTSVTRFTLLPWAVATRTGSAHDSPGRGEPEISAPCSCSRHLPANQPRHRERILRAPSASPSPQPGSAAHRHPSCLRSPSMSAAAGAPQPCLCPAPVCGRCAGCMRNTFTCRSAKPQGPGQRAQAAATGPTAEQTPRHPRASSPCQSGLPPVPAPGRPQAGTRGGGRIWQVKALLPPVLGYFWPRISGEACGFSA